MNTTTAQRWHDGVIAPAPQRVLVFPSNLAAKHSRSFAKLAIAQFKAGYELTAGPNGMAYAIPIKSAKLAVLPIEEIAWSIRGFISYAKNNPDLEFWVARFADDCTPLTDHRVASQFKGAPENCVFPMQWQQHMEPQC